MAIAINITELKHQVEVLGWKRKDIKEHYGFTTQAACNRMLKAAKIKFPAFRPDDSFEFVVEEEVENVSAEQVVEELTPVQEVVSQVEDEPVEEVEIPIQVENVIEAIQQQETTEESITSTTNVEQTPIASSNPWGL